MLHTLIIAQPNCAFPFMVQNFIHIIIGNYYQPSTDCDGCASVGINGLVWRCCRCQDCVFCSTCYFSDKHLVEHDFLRRDDTHSW